MMRMVAIVVIVAIVAIIAVAAGNERYVSLRFVHFLKRGEERSVDLILGGEHFGHSLLAEGILNVLMLLYELNKKIVSKQGRVIFGTSQ